ncbi:hypothetical protein HYV31_02755 [candidate division WWE3 bacterium]|nr:hypothetical protein [candidate division WWE3 bacterium]
MFSRGNFTRNISIFLGIFCATLVVGIFDYINHKDSLDKNISSETLKAEFGLNVLDSSSSLSPNNSIENNFKADSNNLPSNVLGTTTSNVVNTLSTNYGNYVLSTTDKRQLVSSPLDISGTKNDLTPLVVSGNTGNTAEYLIKAKDALNGTDVMKLSKDGDLSIGGVMQLDSQSEHPEDSEDGSMFGLLYTTNDGKSLYFKGSDGDKFKLNSSNYWGFDDNILSTDEDVTSVGIGTDSPATKLTVKTAASSYGVEHTDGTRRLSTYVSPTGGWFGTVSDDPLNFYTNNSISRLTITADGNVGIGTATPDSSRKLHIYDTSTNYVEVESTEGNSGLALTRGAVESYFTNFGDGLGFYAGDGGTIDLVLENGGNLGIGPDINPTELLDIDGDTVRLRDSKTPANSSESCSQGEIVWDSGYVYVCVATDTWKRSTLSAF